MILLSHTFAILLHTYNSFPYHIEIKYIGHVSNHKKKEYETEQEKKPFQ